VDRTAQFAELMQQREPTIRLDEAALLVAAHAYPDLDVDEQRSRLDDLAERCYAPTLDALVHHLFVDERFAGNRRDYYDPRNSFLNDVIERRLGIPITLAVVAIEVGRRIGVPLAGVSMPGHFLLRDKVDPEVFVDPFQRGRFLDRAGCEAAFRRVHGPGAQLDPQFLEPVGAAAIVGRILANLKAVYRARRDREALAWVLRLRLAVPGVPVEERRELATALAADGRFDDAADELELLADQVGTRGGEHRRTALRLRARMN
jgi:regulator of sirC expression with transglutaminase-like and TPR domain